MFFVILIQIGAVIALSPGCFVHLIALYWIVVPFHESFVFGCFFSGTYFRRSLSLPCVFVHAMFVVLLVGRGCVYLAAAAGVK